MKISALGRQFAGALLFALAMGPWTLGHAQYLDFSGQWDMTTNLTAPGEAEPCMYAGTAQIVHDLEQGFLSGTVVLVLVEGAGICPAEMAGEISGYTEDDVIFNGLIFAGMWGEATFTGAPIQAKGDTQPVPVLLGGALEVIVGPFIGGDGGWGGMVSDGVFKDGFETLIVLSAGSSLLLLLAAGMLIHRRRD